MASLSAQRTLVKSPPELWSELSEVDRLAQHLEAFGEIRITKLEPEHTVAWEGEHACGTVSLEPSGWGTTVTFEAALAAEPEPEPEPQLEPEPVAVEPEPEPEPVEDEHAPRRGFWARLFRSWLVREERVNHLAREPAEEPMSEKPVAPEPVPAEPPPPATTIEPRTAQAVLDHTLDTLGSAHHRPFSRS